MHMEVQYAYHSEEKKFHNKENFVSKRSEKARQTALPAFQIRIQAEPAAAGSCILSADYRLGRKPIRLLRR